MLLKCFLFLYITLLGLGFCNWVDHFQKGLRWVYFSKSCFAKVIYCFQGQPGTISELYSDQTFCCPLVVSLMSLKPVFVVLFSQIKTPPPILITTFSMQVLLGLKRSPSWSFTVPPGKITFFCRFTMWKRFNLGRLCHYYSYDFFTWTHVFDSHKIPIVIMLRIT